MILLFELLAIVFEFLTELTSSVVFDLIMRALGHTVKPRPKRNPILAGIGYALAGLIAGGLSLLVFPNSFARSETFHGISLVIAPVLTGFAMAGIGWYFERHGIRRLRLDSFIYGLIMAVPAAIVRFLYTS